MASNTIPQPNHYNRGDMVLLTADFNAVDGGPVDPETVTFTVMDAAGNVTAPTPENPTTGMFTAEVGLALDCAVGVWRYRCTGVGGAPAKQDGQFVVDADTF